MADDRFAPSPTAVDEVVIYCDDCDDDVTGAVVGQDWDTVEVECPDCRTVYHISLEYAEASWRADRVRRLAARARTVHRDRRR